MRQLFRLQAAARRAWLGHLYVGLLLLIAPQWAAAADPPLPYAAATIAPALRRGATSVVRRHDVTITLKRPDRYTLRVCRAVTITHRALDAAATQLEVPYSSLQTIEELSARLYDGNGRPIRRLSGADWHDVSATDADTYLDDTRARVASAVHNEVPYTIEITYEISSRNPLFLPDWQPQERWRQSIERATFRLCHPATLPVRWRTQHLPAQAAQADTLCSGGLTEHRWTLTNAPALTNDQPYAPALAEQAPAVWCAPTAFEVQGHAGRQTTWAEFGAWWYALNAGRDPLPAALTAEMAALRDSVADPRRRARHVYERVQRSTRYVSVQLGLGGWQTLPAADVARTGYGDCKALVTYTGALLRAAGLAAYPALVRAGADAARMHPDWVAPQFNHVILCVPLPARTGSAADTVWLECTSGTRPFATLGDFTAGRPALLVLPTGGRLVRTPTLGPATNRRTRTVRARLDGQGNATAAVRTRSTGNLGDDEARLLLLPPDEQRRIVRQWLESMTPRAELRAVRYAAEAPDGAGAVTREDLSLNLPSAATRAGVRLLLPLAWLHRAPRPAAADTARRAPIWLGLGTSFSDTLVVELPPGTHAEELPAPIALTTDFGTFRSSTGLSADGVRLTHISSGSSSGGEFPASRYPELLAFQAQQARAQRRVVTLLVPAAVTTKAP